MCVRAAPCSPPMQLPPASSAAAPRSEATHVADLILSLFDSLQLRGVSHHAEAFSLVLLKLLLVANLGGMEKKKQNKTDLAMGETQRTQQLCSAGQDLTVTHTLRDKQQLCSWASALLWRPPHVPSKSKSGHCQEPRHTKSFPCTDCSAFSFSRGRGDLDLG